MIKLRRIFFAIIMVLPISGCVIYTPAPVIQTPGYYYNSGPIYAPAPYWRQGYLFRNRYYR